MSPTAVCFEIVSDVAHVVLNRCITSSPEDVHQNDKDYWYRLNFYLLDDTYLDYNPTTVKELSSNTGESDFHTCALRKIHASTYHKSELFNSRKLI